MPSYFRSLSAPAQGFILYYTSVAGCTFAYKQAKVNRPMFNLGYALALPVVIPPVVFALPFWCMGGATAHLMYALFAPPHLEHRSWLEEEEED